MENKIKHLEMIQGIINRMSSNSFSLKGWATTLVAGIFVLADKETDKLYFLVAYIPILVFWGLDSYYLLQERLYRHLYEKTRNSNDNNINFSLEATCEEFGDKEICFFKCLISKTEFGFYIPLALVCGGIIIISHCLF